MTQTVKIVCILVILASVFDGCKKDTETFNSIREKQSLTSIVGLVLNEDRAPLAGAQVQYGDFLTTTDAYGYYKFQNVEVGSEHNFLTIYKDGYFTGCRTFRTDEARTITHETQLLQAGFTESFNSGESATIGDADVKLGFEPNTIVYDGSGKPYNGTVRVAVKHIDPTHTEAFIQMPGDLTGISESGALEALTSFGMVYVRLESPSGEKLQIKSGTSVTMDAQIPEDLQAIAPGEIIMWSFDNDRGVWVEEGTAVRNGNRYVGNVGHFSCWNYDYPEPSVTVSGRLITDDGAPISQAHLLITSSPKGAGGHGSVNADGTFSGRVTKGKRLYVYALRGYEPCTRGGVEIAQIGPFYSNANVGDLVYDNDKVKGNILKIKGNIKGCNGKGIDNGHVVVDYQNYFPVTSGLVNGNVTYCSSIPTSVPVRVIDRESLQQMDFTGNVVNDVLDLGTLKVCGDSVDYVQFKSTGLGFDKNIVDLLSLVLTGPQDQVALYANAINDSCRIQFAIDNNGIEEGTFDINSEAYVRIVENGKITDYFHNPSGTIDVRKDKTKGVYRGVYSLTVTNSQDNSDVQTFDGKFRIKY